MKKQLIFALAMLLGIFATAQDKNGYHLFNPVPKDSLRPLTGDRPDFTEAAYTVDAGRLQIETDLVRTYFSKVGDTTRLTNFSALPLFFRLGILNHLEVQFMAEIAHFYRTYDDGPKEYYYKPRFLQEAGVRVKLNIIGNDKGRFALAVMPYLIYQNFGPIADSLIDLNFLPNVDPHPLYGFAIPVSYQINHKWDLAGMLEYQQDEFFSTFAYMAVLNHNITDRYGIMAELYNSHISTNFNTNKTTSINSILNVAFTYLSEENFQFDGGVAFGLQEGSGFQPYVGFIARF